MHAALPDVLPIVPFTRPVTGEIELPGSKSLTNRALLIAALCEEPVALTGALFSDDTRLMVGALRQLGYVITTDETARTLHLAQQSRAFSPETAGSPERPVELFVGLAGTAARFLTALCAVAPRGHYRIDGVPQMRRRPMRGLIDALRVLGATIRCLGEEGFFPLEIQAHGLHGGPVAIDASDSSQMLSALLMIAPRARDPVRVRLAASVRQPFVQMTGQLMGQFGVEFGQAGETGEYLVGRAAYRPPGTYRIEPDATAASYFAALPLATGGQMHIRALSDSRLQGDTRFLDVVRQAGAEVRPRAGGIDVAYDRPSVRRGVTQDFTEFSDTFLTLAALSPLLSGPTRISGIAHTRKQETDRVAGMASELRRLGQDVVEEEDALTITPRPLPRGPEPIVIQTYHDHRFAMSFGVLGCHDLQGDGRPWLAIADPACCAKTFPDFFARLEALRHASH